MLVQFGGPLLIPVDMGKMRWRNGNAMPRLLCVRFLCSQYFFLNNPNSSDCLLSDAESSSSDSPVADKRAPGSERAAERAAQQNERERIRLAPQTSFANMQVHTHMHTTGTQHAQKNHSFAGIKQ